MPQINDGILLLEDIGEAPHRVERMFWQLKHAGILDRQRAIILGAFTDCEPAASMRYPYSLAGRLKRCAKLHPAGADRLPVRSHSGESADADGAAAEIAISGPQYTLAVRDHFSR